jgi:hypothetical protein
MVDHCVQRYSVYVAEKPPMTGPRPRNDTQLLLKTGYWGLQVHLHGPKNGAMTTRAPGAAIFVGSKRSVTVPAPTARHGAPAIPAKVRHISNPANEFEKPAPRIKSIYAGILILYTMARPRVSEIGAASNGPRASPRTNNDRGSTAAVRETWNLFAIAMKPGVIIDEPAVTLKQSSETGMTWLAFFTRWRLVLDAIRERSSISLTGAPIPRIFLIMGRIPTVGQNFDLIAYLL